MSAAPPFEAIDHLHVHVTDRPAAEAWYRRVLGLRRVAALAHWAAGGGPLTLADDAGQLHLALFERPPRGGQPTIALRVPAAGLLDWRAHLRRELGQAPDIVDHGETRSIYFADPDGNGFEITTAGREGEGPVLHALLDAELGRAPEYLDAHRASVGDLPADGGAYSSHLPMALHALAALGADDTRLQQWADKAFAAVPGRVAWPALDAAEQGFAALLRRDGVAATMAQALPALMPGCGGMAFHLLIRTAHAWEAGHEAQLARALAHWQVRAAPLPGPAEVDHEGLDWADWVQALLALPRPAGMTQPWISARMRHVAAAPGFQDLAPRLRLVPGLLAQGARWAAMAYAGSGNFTLLHALTASRAAGLLLPLMPAAARPAALRAFTRQLGAALIASRWPGPGAQAQRSESPEPPGWDELRTQAIAHDDEHVIKVVHAAWQLGRTEADPVWRQAAARALDRTAAPAAPRPVGADEPHGRLR